MAQWPKISRGLLEAVARTRTSLAAAVLFGAVAPAYSGAPQEESLAQMDHAAWTARDGAPQGIRALAQAADGTLWIGSEAGLYFFDGRTFTAFKSIPGEPQLPAEPVLSICIARDDSLWMGFLQAGAAHLAHGHVRLYPNMGKEPLGLVHNLRQSADGDIWAVSGGNRLVRFGADLTWHIEQLPVDKARTGGFLIDSSNTLWLAQGGRLYRRPLARSAYTVTDVEADLTFGFAEAPDGSIWVTDAMLKADRGRTQHVDHAGHLITLLPDAEFTYDILYAPGGSVILATQDHGLHRFFAADVTTPDTSAARRSPDVFTSINGLTSDHVRALLLDADGNIWAGGRRGLDRVRKAQLVRFLPGKPSNEWEVCAGKNGALWIAGDNELYKASGGVPVLFSNKEGGYKLYCADDGDVWLANHAGLRHVHADRLSPVPDVPGAPPDGVTQLAATSDHTLYATILSSVGGGYWQYKSDKWTKVGEGMPWMPVGVAYADSRDRLWTGHRDGLITLPLENRTLSSGDPGLGIVRAILDTSHGLLATGTNGVAVLRGNRFEMLTFVDEASTRGVQSIVESRNGDLWLNASHGIVRVSASEVDSALSRPDYRMKSDLLAEGDFVGAAQGIGATAARGADGSLWFVTLNGVVRIDPEHWRPQSRPPIVSIKSIAADHRPVNDDGAIGPRPQVLEFRYFGVNLTAPEQVIYRYRLDGFDDTWQDVGHRTEAIYTRIPSGTYTFRVIASNGNGEWTAPVSTASITVLPSFYQTNWFAAMCIGAVLVILWLAFRIRVRAITREVRARAEERADERIRIARELHDTLLQGIQGLLLTLHVAAQKIAPNDESKVMLERALFTADRIIIEGRNRVSRLRSEHLNDSELIASLENVCNDLKSKDSVLCRVSRHGACATLHAHVADEIFLVAREALTNAFRHSQASHITLDLVYGKRFFTMTCNDDGRGFEPEEQNETGHWGLKGMAERVQRLGGELCYRSAPQHGTEIRVSIPSYRAYPNHSRAGFYLRAPRF